MNNRPGQSAELDAVAEIDPLRGSPPRSAGIESAMNEIASAIALTSARAGSRRKLLTRPRIAGVVAAVLAASAGVAAADVFFGAHTGLFPTKAERAVGGPGEALDPAAPDFRAVAFEAAEDIPYPDGYSSWRDWVIEGQAPTPETGPGGATYPAGLVSTGALRGWFAASAFCAWVQSWRNAVISGDSATAGGAAAAITHAPGWKGVRDEDAQPDPGKANDAGAERGTIFGWMLPYREAVLAGDRSQVEHLLATGYGNGKCWLADPQWMAEVRAHRDWAKLPPLELAKRYERFLQRGGS
jgi:hypothetical protein